MIQIKYAKLHTIVGVRQRFFLFGATHKIKTRGKAIFTI